MRYEEGERWIVIMKIMITLEVTEVGDTRNVNRGGDNNNTNDDNKEGEEEGGR